MKKQTVSNYGLYGFIFDCKIIVKKIINWIPVYLLYFSAYNRVYDLFLLLFDKLANEIFYTTIVANKRKYCQVTANAAEADNHC